MFQESCQHRPAPKYPQYTMYKFLSCNVTKCQDYIVQHCYLVKIYNILLFVFEESCQPGSALKRSPTIFFSLFIFQSIIMLNPFTFSNRFNSPIIIVVKYCDRHLIDFVALFSDSIHSSIYYLAKTSSPTRDEVLTFFLKYFGLCWAQTGFFFLFSTQTTALPTLWRY